MKKRTFTALWCLITLTFLLSSNTSAQDISVQQNSRAKTLNNVDSLESSLARLEQGLKGSVAVDFRQRYARRTYVRLKRRGGCNISFQISLIPGSPYVNQTHRASPELSSAEWRMNLSDLDSAEVKIEKPEKGDYRVIRFATMGGKASLKWEGFGVQDVGWPSRGEIHVSEKESSHIAAALEQAIRACQK
jgi:hypothetical protein